MADTDNKIAELKAALQKVLDFLNKPEVGVALGKIPASIKDPVFKGLDEVLDVIKTALTEIKDNLGAVTSVKELLKVIDDLLTAAAGLASGNEETAKNLERVKGIVKTLQDLPDAAEIEAVIALIQQIVTKLESL